MSKLNSKVTDTAPVRPVAGTEILEPATPFEPIIDTKEVTVGLVPYQVDDILDYEVRIAECSARNNIRDIRIRNDYFSIAKIIHLFSEGYFISPYYNEDVLEPFFQQVFFIDYWYGNDPNFKQELKDKNIFPTFIIEHEEGGAMESDHTAILCYCFNEPITSEQLVADIYDALCKNIFDYEDPDTEIDCYNIYDYGKITNVTISNNIYIPLEGGIAHE